MAVIIIRLWSKYFFDLTAHKAVINKMATQELIIAFACAKTWALKPKSIFNLKFAKNATAANTMIETIQIIVLDLLSFYKCRL